MNDNSDENNDLPLITYMELLELAQSVIALPLDKLLRMLPGAEQLEFASRFYRLYFSNATLTWVINAFDVCDLSFVEFNSLADVAICRHLCRKHYIQLEEDLWMTEDLFIQCTTKVADNDFCFGWRHDEVLCKFG